MAQITDSTIATRQKYIHEWNKKMIHIWQSMIFKLKVRDTDALYRSPAALNIITDPDGKYIDITLRHEFLEYGLWQDLGTGREFHHDNGGKLEFLDTTYRARHYLDRPRKVGPKWGGGYTSGNPRIRRRWFSSKYYSSCLNLRDFMAESLGDEFKAFFADLDADILRHRTQHYRNKGWS